MAKKSEEVKRLKALKMREIRKKLNLVSKESGLAEDGSIHLASDVSETLILTTLSRT